MARDLYSRLDEIDQSMLRTIADVLELRGRHPRQVAIRARYLDALGDLTGKRVLDLGCGTGVVTRDLARRVGASGSVLGSDPTPPYAEVAERLRAEAGLENASFAVQDGRSLPFSDESFDLVAAVTVLCHVPEREAVLREMARVTRPGGTVLIVDGEYAANQVEHPDRTTTTRIVDAWRASVVDDPYLTRRLASLLRKVGLEPTAVDGHIHVEAGQVDEATSFIWQWALFAVRQALTTGAITEDEGALWTSQLRVMNERGELFGSVTYVSVQARKP